MSEHKPDEATIFFPKLESGRLGPRLENYCVVEFERHTVPFEEPAFAALKESKGTSC
jgi:hypothetical protein